MNTETFLANFHTIANAPGGIARLREMIMQLAVQGKLVKQNPNDEPASELLKKIEVEKESLTVKGAKGGIEQIKDEDKPYKLPSNWEWVRLGRLVELITKGSSPTWQGIRYTENPNDLLFITSENVRNYELKLDKVKYVEWRFNEIEPRSILRKNDILMNLVGGSIGRTALYHLDKVANINQATCIIRMNDKLNNLRFFLHFFNSPTCLSYMFDKQVSNARENLSMESVRSFSIPLPPLSEQKRIVEKVDSLMALCDKLEVLQKKKVELNSLTRKTAFTVLGNANEPSELKAAWARVEVNTQYLLDSEEAVEEMKKTILQNAIKGNLVPQDPNDEPASELLKKIEAEKSLTTKSTKNTKGGGNKFDTIKDKEIPFTVQKGWEWVRLGEIANVSMGQSPDGDTYNDKGVGVPLVNGPVEFGGKDPFSKTLAIKFTTSPTKMCKKGDLLLCVRGSTTGRTNIAGYDSCIGRGVAALRPYIDNNFFNYFILGNRQGLYDTGTGSTFPNISYDKIVLYTFPLPPLEEQKRIVEKVDSLFAICNRLQKQLADAKTTAANLAKAAVESLTGTFDTQGYSVTGSKEKEKMKAPKTELVSMLRLSKAPTVKDKAPLSAILLKHNESMSAKNLWLNSGMEIDQFYQQLKSEMANGWIVEPEKAFMQVVE